MLGSELRKIIVELSYRKKLGHVGSALSCVELLLAIFENKKDDDKFILSKGHAILAYYALMALLKVVDLQKLLNQNLSLHPSIYHPPCPDWSSGSLGHGLAVAMGLAMAKYKSFVLMSEGEFNEGSTWESILFAGERKCKVVIVVDVNGWQAFTKTFPALQAEELAKKLRTFGWHACVVDGHDKDAVSQCIRMAQYPQAVIAKTVKGKGVGNLEDKLSSHYYPIDEETYVSLNA